MGEDNQRTASAVISGAMAFMALAVLAAGAIGEDVFGTPLIRSRSQA